MSDFQNPIQRNDKNPIEQPQAIPPIEKDKKERQDQENYPSTEWYEEEARSFLIASLFSSIKKIIDNMGSASDSNTQSNPDRLKKDLKSLRDLFLILCSHDQSHNSEYLYNLSELWHGLLSDFSNIDIAERKTIPIASKINDLTKDILHYPPGEDHSLGYYLTEHAGREWIPFPLMNLLQDLYKQHQKNPGDSKLVFWIALLNTMISDLDAL